MLALDQVDGIRIEQQRETIGELTAGLEARYVLYC